jgi:hypothetical protein
MKIVEKSNGFVRLRVRLNLWSFGEKIDIVLGTLNGAALIDITSTCIMPTQIADWGKNRRNVRMLFNELDSLLGEKCEHDRCFICGNCGYLLAGLAANVCPECGGGYSSTNGEVVREQATFVRGLKYALVFSGIEIAGCMLLEFVGLGDFLPSVARGSRGAILLVSVNVGTIAGVIGVHRIAKRYFITK